MSSATITYDKTSQLTGADHANPRADESYTYDDNGNRTGGSYDTDPNNLTVSDGTYDYEYDDEGNRTKRTTISSGDYEVYEWDHRNRLISVTFYDSMDTELKSVDHTYDIFNRWVRRTTDPDGPGGSSAVDTFFAYDGIEPILQFDGPADTDLTNRYLFGRAVDQIMASEAVTSLGSAGNILWALSDHLGTPRDLADQNESTYTTTVTNHRTYDSFGKRTAETNSAVDLVFGFTAKAFDEETGLGNHWNRWLGFELDQWLNHDPSGFAARDNNLRRYVKNSVTTFIDPTGWEEVLPGEFPVVDKYGDVDKNVDPVPNPALGMLTDIPDLQSFVNVTHSYYLWNAGKPLKFYVDPYTTGRGYLGQKGIMINPQVARDKLTLLPLIMMELANARSIKETQALQRLAEAGRITPQEYADEIEKLEFSKLKHMNQLLYPLVQNGSLPPLRNPFNTRHFDPVTGAFTDTYDVYLKRMKASGHWQQYVDDAKRLRGGGVQP